MPNKQTLKFFNNVLQSDINVSKEIRDMVFKAASSQQAEPIIQFINTSYFDPALADEILIKLFNSRNSEAFLKVTEYLLKFEKISYLPYQCLMKSIKSKNNELITFCSKHADFDSFKPEHVAELSYATLAKAEQYKTAKSMKSYRLVIEGILGSISAKHFRPYFYYVVLLNIMFEEQVPNFVAGCKYVNSDFLIDMLKANDISPADYLADYPIVAEQKANVLRLLG